jgi:flagellar motor switch/type III secretory pathway protein FliN
VARALGELLASDVVIAVRRVSPFTEYAGGRRALSLRSIDGSLAIAVEPEPALASALIARILDRPSGLTAPDAPLDPRTQGALSAIAVETARRSGEGVLLLALPGEPLEAAGLRVDCVVRVDRVPFAATLWITAARCVARRPGPVPLDRLGDVPLTLVLVAAISAGSRADILALSPGDVWMPGSWLCGGLRGGPKTPLLERVAGRLALASPNGERGIGVAHSEGSGFVVRGEVIALGADEPADPLHAQKAKGATMSDDAAKYRDDTLREIALDAPVVVRVEVASVTLSAREWAELSTGDTLATGVRLTPQVVLRVAGREVARGDLVDIDGEVGVTISELLR